MGSNISNGSHREDGQGAGMPNVPLPFPNANLYYNPVLTN